jgi:hypothetical protein
MEEGATGGRGNAGADAASLDVLFPALLADGARIRSSKYTINSSVSLSVTERNIVPPFLM